MINAKMTDAEIFELLRVLAQGEAERIRAVQERTIVPIHGEWTNAEAHDGFRAMEKIFERWVKEASRPEPSSTVTRTAAIAKQAMIDEQERRKIPDEQSV